MTKKYIVSLTKKEREELGEVVSRLKGTSQKVRRAQILLKSDARGPGWTDAKIAEAFSCRIQTIENLRKRLVTEGFAVALHGKIIDMGTHAESLSRSPLYAGLHQTELRQSA
jgi:hypothetical protein